MPRGGPHVLDRSLTSSVRRQSLAEDDPLQLNYAIVIASMSLSSRSVRALSNLSSWLNHDPASLVNSECCKVDRPLVNRRSVQRRDSSWRSISTSNGSGDRLLTAFVACMMIHLSAFRLPKCCKLSFMPEINRLRGFGSVSDQPAL